MKNMHRKRRIGGFGILELAIVLVTLVLLAIVLLPMLAKAKARPKAINCVSNLKQVGLAFRMWANDNEGKFPMAVSTNKGGSMEYNNSGQVFRHFLAASNELCSPKTLVCPKDSKRTKVGTWIKNFSNQNVSYFVQLDAQECYPQMILSGDRNISGGTITNGNVMLFATNSPAGWTKEIHVQCGNIGLADGSAQQVTETGLRKQLQANTKGITRMAIP